MMGLCRKDALIVGSGMAPRSEVAMIVALIGLEAGIIGHCVYVHVDDQEYEVVLRTVRPHSHLPLTNDDKPGPLAQE